MSIPVLKHILYVEDEPDIQKIVKYALEKIGGFSLKVCNSGYEALDALSEYTPDLVLMDVMMPGIDGPTTFQAIRKKTEFSNLPVIFMTAKVQANEIQNYQDLGILHVIVKPFDIANLSNEINDIWEKQYA